LAKNIAAIRAQAKQANWCCEEGREHSTAFPGFQIIARLTCFLSKHWSITLNVIVRKVLFSINQQAEDKQEGNKKCQAPMQ